MGESRNMSKRKEDLLASTKELAKEIGPRIRALREKREMNQREFYDFLFPESKYQTMSDGATPKTEGMKNKDIGEIESGKAINISGTPFNKETGLAIHLALLLRISEKCGVSLDYLIAGKDFHPEGTSCPPEEKAISGGDVVEPSHADIEIPPEEKKMAPISDCLSYSPSDICMSFAALSLIADLEIHELRPDNGRLGKCGVRIDIRPKEIINAIKQGENGLEFVPNTDLKLYADRYWNTGYDYDYSSVRASEIPSNYLALHLTDKRADEIIHFLVSNFSILRAPDIFLNLRDNGWRIETASKDEIGSALGFGIDFRFGKSIDIMGHYDDKISTLLEPFSTFINRARKEKGK